MKKSFIAILSLLLVYTLACARGDDDDSSSTESGSSVSDSSGDSGVIGIGDTNDSNSSSSARLRISTYNLGLLPAFVPQSDQRAALIAQRLASDSSDILCLQEVWRASDRQLIDSQIRAQFPFSMRVAARQKFAESSPACSLSSFEPMAACLLSNCSFGSQDLLACASTNCREPVFQLAADDPLCAAALFAQSGRSSSEINEIQDELLSEDTNAGLFAFGGESGTILYSKRPLENQRALDFFDVSTTSRRVALFATVEQGDQELLVGCTHLTSNLDGILPYTGSFASWGAETAAQASDLIRTAENLDNGAIVLAGDFNCSEANAETGAQADLANVCQMIRAAGYEDAAAQSLRCTYCNENILNQLKVNQGEQLDLVLDHLFSRGSRPLSGVSLLFDENVDIDGAASNLSDHYGVTGLSIAP